MRRILWTCYELTPANTDDDHSMSRPSLSLSLLYDAPLREVGQPQQEQLYTSLEHLQ